MPGNSVSLQYNVPSSHGTIKTKESKIKARRQVLRQWHRVVWWHHGVTAEIKNGELNRDVTLIAVLVSTVHSPLDGYLDFIFQVCWWDTSDTLTNLLKKRYSTFPIRELRELLIQLIDFGGYSKTEFSKLCSEKNKCLIRY